MGMCDTWARIDGSYWLGPLANVDVKVINQPGAVPAATVLVINRHSGESRPFNYPDGYSELRAAMVEGAQYDALKANVVSPERAPQQRYVRCQFCRCQNIEGHDVCSNCGAPLG